MSWLIIWIIPQFIISYSYIDIKLKSFILIFFLTQLAFNALYEIGYIENDVTTTKNEKTPTLRLEKSIYRYIKKHYNKIIRIRYLIVITVIILLYILNKCFEYNLNIYGFIIVLIINRLFFYWHNIVRSKINLLTFAMLAITKYIFIFVIFINDFNKLLYVVLFSMVIFPILRIIEHSTHKRYQFVKYAKIIGNHDIFRIKYYLFNLVLLIIIYNLYPKFCKNYKIFIYINIYFLFYRVLSYFILKKGLYKRDYLKSKDLYIQKDSY
jgi:hypothetical protein